MPDCNHCRHDNSDRSHDEYIKADDGAMAVQWFPGHMAKARRTIKEAIKLVDVVAELVDARIPNSSRNPELKALIGEKPHIIILNKCDMADARATQLWAQRFRDEGSRPLFTDCKSGRGLNTFAPAALELMAEKLERLREKGVKNRPVRAMVVGIPNVGKSFFINRLCGLARAKVENRPGVTRQNQWFTVSGELELLDTPGVLWPKFEDKTVGEHLAFTGAVRDTILDSETLACRLLARITALDKGYDELIAGRYKFDKTQIQGLTPPELLALIGRKRGLLLKGGSVDLDRASNLVIEEFRAIKLGRITLEWPGG